MRSFQFVHATGELRQDDDKYRKAVRSSAMRAWRQEERLRQVAKHRSRVRAGAEASKSRPLLLQSSSPWSDVHEDSSASEDAPSPLTITKSDFVGMDRTDPFAAMALPLPADYQGLTHHFATCIGQKMVPLGGSRGPNSWAAEMLQHALSSPVLTLAMCCHASSHMSFCKTRTLDLPTLKLRSATINAINQSLQDATAMASDGTFAAVSLLTADALIFGDATELHHHFAALKHLVRLRGDAHDRSLSGVLARSLPMHSTPIQILTRSASRKPPLPPPFPPQTTSYPPSPPHPPSHVPPPRPSPHPSRLSSLDPLLAHARDLSHLLASPSSAYARTLGAQLAFSDVRSELEIRAFAYMEAWEGGDTTATSKRGEEVSVDDRVALVTCVALLLFSIRHLRGFTVWSVSVRALMGDFGEAVLRVEGFGGLERGGKGEGWLFWAVVMGLQAYTGEKGGRVEGRLRWLFGEGRGRLGLKGREEIEGFLRERGVWVEEAWTEGLGERVEEVIAGEEREGWD